MEIRTYKVYKFDELPEEAKQKAIEKNNDINVDYGDWYYSDGMLDLSAEEMASRRIELSPNWYESTKPKNVFGNIIGEYPAYTGLIKYSDEIYFDLDRSNYIQFNDIEIMDQEVFRKWLRIPPYLWDKVTYSFNNRNERNTEIEFIKEDYQEFTKKEEEIIDRAINIWDRKVIEALEHLKEQYRYLTSEESIVETLKANDYDLTINGEID